jgi:hypothetical protein
MVRSSALCATRRTTAWCTTCCGPTPLSPTRCSPRLVDHWLCIPVVLAIVPFARLAAAVLCRYLLPLTFVCCVVGVGSGSIRDARRAGLWPFAARLSELWRGCHRPLPGAAPLPARLSGSPALSLPSSLLLLCPTFVRLIVAGPPQGHEAQKSGVGVSMRSRLTTIFSTSRDHFGSDVEATCGCVLVPARPSSSAAILSTQARTGARTHWRIDKQQRREGGKAACYGQRHICRARTLKGRARFCMRVSVIVCGLLTG